MRSTKPTAAERHDTWEPGWDERLSAHVRACGYASVWDYIRRHPAEPYAALAEKLAESGNFGVAPIQIERLQVRDTPAAELRASVRDSLVRHLRAAFVSLGWGTGPYWESTAIGALVSWSAMWSKRVDVTHLKHRLFELHPPAGWLPEDDRDAFVMRLIPDDVEL